MRTLSPWPQRTTITVGVLVLISGALLLIGAIRPTLAISDTAVIPVAGPVVSLLAAIARATAFLLAATGVHGELGLAAQSRTGKAALIVWGLRDLTFLVIDSLVVNGSPPAAVQAAGLVLQAVFPIAALAAAISIARARVLAGNVRWVLLPLAIIEVLFSALFNLPATTLAQSIALTLASLPTEFLEPTLMLLSAIALLTWGRTEALKHGARTIHDAW